MQLLRRLLAAATAGGDAEGPGPFAVLVRAGGVDVLAGDVVTADTLAAIPLDADRPTLAVVPFRQVAERGFACVDDGAPLECLRATATERLTTAELLAELPDADPGLTARGFDVSDERYAATVADVLRDEIGRGEGANFVVHRTFTATTGGPVLPAALATLRRLLAGERGAYWTFLVHTGARTLVGATPERHVSVDGGLAMMNPISGTFRGPADDRDALLAFLADRKEVDELAMVLDEELKMMAVVAEHGGQVVGPYLKPMANLTHTEYLLAGRTTRDVRDVLRETMFAPTVTGSPMENACRVIARHERRGRRYYAGVLALLGHDADGRQSLDAPILIRTAEFTPDGVVRVPVGATLVRHSTPEGEVAETYAKAAGILAALGLRAPAPVAPVAAAPAEDPEVLRTLAGRNEHLARFWLDHRVPGELTVAALAGRTAVVVDAEDTFTGMLAHQLRALGLTVDVRPWHAPGDLDADLVVAGPGPGDPRDLTDPKMAAVDRLVGDRLAAGRPLLAVCLGHQVLAARLGLRLHRRAEPYQGVARDIDLFGAGARVGFYSTFTAQAGADAVDTPYGRAELARDGLAVHALRGPAFAGVQFHPESVLSRDGVAVLSRLLPGLCGAGVPPVAAAPGPR
ncbi:anthranilate synthase family protein [Spirilliplanes yamanashiensis]|uniref:anthranilate synthase n=1 Tax=Spirilliplanes yamanashiensis TaxID=42233 RepID=A0A8J4DIW1_9ACTN|nr:anthranilate synthase family protein [Spirilliplanes yamanashiensis]MDP9817186.1 phenazine biosynthesis protein phzE [Spirilliplanes yamanashiensis]GIJ03161.1 phenazine-specific anthranilate synthase component I [Spirilliplanes yamanashiensis]